MWNLEKYAENKAIIDDAGVSVTYADIECICRKIKECTHRCVVLCLCRNTIGSAVGYISFINSMIVPIMLNSAMEEDLLENIIIKYKPELIWCPTEFCGRSIRFSQMDIMYSAYDYSLIKTEFDRDYPVYEELALLLTTSGSTGSPKFVRQSYENIRSNTESIVEYLKIDESERAITTLPMNYTYGLSIINTHIMAGATLLMTEKSIMQKEFWSFFNEQQATSFGGVPYTYEILDKLHFTEMELPSLRTMTQAGGKLALQLHNKLAEFAEKTGKKFIVMYGQCEATARMGYLPAEKAMEKCGSMGIAIPGGKFELIDDNGRVIDSPETTGELVYEGANVALGYAECIDDLALGDERCGRLETGDMACFDRDGCYYIVGRKKRFLKIYGNRINLDEVDRLIKGKFDNINCASAGVDDHLYVFLTDKDPAKKIKNFLIEKTKLNPAAFTTVIIDEIPKNDAGKILYKELEKYYKC